MKKNVLSRKERFEFALPIFEEMMPEPVSELNFSSPFQLLIAVILSAQCTDKRVNMVTPALFAAFPTPQAMAQASLEALESYIKTCGFHHSKAKDIIACAQKLVNEFDGQVPRDLDTLLTLPGVGRKTANLLLGDIFGTPGSVVCDTHCIRICERLGLSKGKDPEKVEQQLRKILPPEESSDFCHRIVLFGRDCCTARNPKCDECPLTMFCKEFNP